jgi:hypothetical protein
LLYSDLKRLATCLSSKSDFPRLRTSSNEP